MVRGRAGVVAGQRGDGEAIPVLGKDVSESMNEHGWVAWSNSLSPKPRM